MWLRTRMRHVFIYPSVSIVDEGKYLCDMLRRTADDSLMRQVFKSYFLGREFRL